MLRLTFNAGVLFARPASVSHFEMYFRYFLGPDVRISLTGLDEFGSNGQPPF